MQFKDEDKANNRFLVKIPFATMRIGFGRFDIFGCPKHQTHNKRIFLCVTINQIVMGNLSNSIWVE